MATRGEVTKVNDDELVPVPYGFVTAIGPVVAVEGTVAAISVSELIVKLALTPLNVTAEIPAKFPPVIVTEALAMPLAGVKEVIEGEPFPERTEKLSPLTAVPLEVATLIEPEVAPAGTVAVI